MRLVYIIGNKESGKSTHADWLVEKHGFVRMSLASPIRRIAAHIISKYCGMSVEKIEDYLFTGDLYSHFKTAKVECDGITLDGLRRLLEGLGEGVCEELEELAFVNKFIKDFKALDPSARVVLDDARKPFEASALEELGGVGIFLNKPGSDKPDVVTERCQHNVDTGLIVPSFTIDYDLGIEGSQARLTEVLNLRI
ncbi:MAG: hypothetical protein JRJ68_03220 [Deltaproteobacteria bacterium]|nr:hypothetical protein [Deltaproteobacteria bacterium]